MATHGTNANCQLRRTMSELEGEAEDMCSWVSSSQFDPFETFARLLYCW
jgi:hypothetical protein